MTKGPRIVDVVFDQPAPSYGRWLTALAAALALHATFAVWARLRQASLEEWADELALRLHAELSRQDAIEIEKPLPPKPPEPEPPKPPPPLPPPVKAPVVKNAPPPPPAQAAQVVAQAPPSEPPAGPVDFSDSFVVGTGKSYAGGVTASSGTSQTAVHAEKVEARAPPSEDYSRPVSLSAQAWQCPWPHEADVAEVDEQSVVLRVEVSADGDVRSARLLSDPGFGFGPAALACAERTRFEPAHDRSGRSIASVSPPIRVRFTR